MKKQGLLSLTGIALLALIVLMTLQEWDYAAPPPPAARPDTPTLVLEQMQALRHTADGAIQYRLEASGLTWFEASDRSALDAPSVEMFGNKGRWLIKSKQGEMRQSEKIIDLQGQVLAQREGESPLLLETEQLIYQVEQERLQIPVAATITHEGGQTRAGELDADLKNGILTMRNGVETRYAPAQ